MSTVEHSTEFNKNLTVADLLGIEDTSIVKLPIPEWNGNVFIKSLSAHERSEIEDLFMGVMQKNSGSGKFRRELIRRTLVTEDGTRMVEDEAMANHLMKKNANAVERIFDKACEVNGFRQKDVDTLKKK